MADDGAPFGTGPRPADQAAAHLGAPRFDPSRSSISSAGMLGSTVYASCPICFGSRVALGGQCITCADPDVKVARRVLEQLTPEQMTFLRSFGHTLAYQPIDGAEWDHHRESLYVEADDGEYDEEREDWLIPPTRHWIGAMGCRMGPCGWLTFIRYTTLGVLLRECLMAGAAAHVRHSTASAIEARSGETREAGLDADRHESAVGTADAPNPKGALRETLG